MFLGECLCMIAHLAARSKAVEPSPSTQGSLKQSLLFAIPAVCDMVGTGTMYAGLCLSYASVFQLRGSSVVFTALISTFFLKRTQLGFQWFAVLLVVVGVLVVGFVSLNNDGSDSKGSSAVLFGNILIVVAQLIVAIQMCVEEKIMNIHQTPALKAVGLEGIFGGLILGTLLMPMYFIRFNGLPFENLPDAITQMRENAMILVAMGGSMLSIACFNFFGISVTKSMSASHRMVLDSVRTMLVWACSLALGWEEFHVLQLVGFAILSVGTAMYNEIITFPRCFHYPEKVAMPTEPCADASKIQSEALMA